MDIEELQKESASARLRMAQVITRYQQGEATLADMDAAARELEGVTKRFRATLKAASKRPKGRPPIPPSERQVLRSIRLAPPLWAKVEANGGIDWLRHLIEHAGPEDHLDTYGQVSA